MTVFDFNLACRFGHDFATRVGDGDWMIGENSYSHPFGKLGNVWTMPIRGSGARGQEESGQEPSRWPGVLRPVQAWAAARREPGRRPYSLADPLRPGPVEPGPAQVMLADQDPTRLWGDRRTPLSARRSEFSGGTTAMRSLTVVFFPELRKATSQPGR